MKKLLLVLAMVAMASFLLVGCLGTTPVTVTGVTLDQTTLDLTAGGATRTLVATVAPTDAADKTVTWASSAEAVATVAAGVVTPLTEGAATITVTTDDGSLTATCEVTVAAAVVPVPPVDPTITTIPDATVAWDEEPWTYQVVATLGTGTTLTYSLIGAPVSMSISSTGLITWTTILDIADLEEVTVKVVDNDGLSAEETFIIEVKEPVVPDFVDKIEYDSDYFYDDGTTKFVRSGAVPVEVTLIEALVTGETLQIQWNDITGTLGGWEPLTLKTGETLVYEGDVTFNGGWDDCELVCVEVRIIAICCDEQLFVDPEKVKVDSADPCADFELTFTDCGACVDTPGMYMSFTSVISGACEDADVCEDCCSGVGAWKFTVIPPATICDTACDEVIGSGCAIAGSTACDCLIYSLDEEVPVSYEIDVSIKDNVGNEFTDTWTITLDTDEVTGVAIDGTGTATVVTGLWTVDYDDCAALMCD